MSPAEALAAIEGLRPAEALRCPQHRRLVSAMYLLPDGSRWLWLAARRFGTGTQPARAVPLDGVTIGAVLGVAECSHCHRGAVMLAEPAGVRVAWTEAGIWAQVQP